MTTPLQPWQSRLEVSTPIEDEAKGSVPRIIHQIYFQGRDAIPAEIAANIEALKTRNPDWEYRFYDREAARAFVSESYGPDMLAYYQSIDPAYYAARADLLRYLICYAHGGIYLDIKSSAERPLDEILFKDDVFILSQWNALKDLSPDDTSHPAAHPQLRHIKGFEYVQWFVMTAPRHPMLGAVIDGVLNRIDRYDPFKHDVGRIGVLRLTGPIAYTLAIEPLRDTVPHRYADFEAELGLVFSIYGDHKQHRTALGTHYSQKTDPIVRSNRLKDSVARLYFGFLIPKSRRIKHILRRLRQIIGRGAS